MASIFNKVLCVKKTTKFERLKSTGFFQSSYVENKLMKTWYVNLYFMYLIGCLATELCI